MDRAREADIEGRPNPQRDRHLAQAGPRRILVVDDDVDSATSLALLLGSDGHEVWTANDGATALDEASQRRPDAALLDLRLDDMSGYDLARELRRLLGPEPVLVALTGLEGESVRSRCHEAGFDRYLLKPVLDFDLLRASLRRA